MHDFSLFYVLATFVCIALAVWLRVRLFGRLDTEVDAGATPAGAEAPLPQRQIVP